MEILISPESYDADSSTGFKISSSATRDPSPSDPRSHQDSLDQGNVAMMITVFYHLAGFFDGGFSCSPHW